MSEANLSQYAGPFITILVVLIGGSAMWGKIKNMVESNKQDVENVKARLKDCVQKDDCKREMDRGDVKFQEIKTDIKDIKNIQSKQDMVLTKIDTTLTLWAKNSHLPLPKDD